MKILQQISELLLLLILWLLIIVCLVLPLMPFWIIRLTVKLIEEYLYNKLYDAVRIRSEEIVSLYDGPKNRTIIHVLGMTEEQLDINMWQKAVYIKMVEARSDRGVRMYPRATRYVHAGYFHYYWVEERNFNISDHVYEWSEEIISSEEELQELISELSSRPLISSQNKSPWENVIIHYSIENRVKSAVLLRSNHCLADGVSFMYFLINQLNDAPIVQRSVPKLSATEKSLIWMKSSFRIPLIIFKNAFIQPEKHVLHCTSISGKKHMAWSKPIDLRLIKEIKNKLKVTVNDVLVGCLATNINLYFLEKKFKPPRDFMVSFPVDTRLSIDEAKEFSNKFALTLLAVPTDCADPLKTILETRRRINNLKMSGDAFAIRTAWRISAFFLPDILNNYIYSIPVAKVSMVLTNVPGPQSEVSIAGSKLDVLTCWPPQKDNIGLGVSITSYNGTVRVGVCSDHAVLENPKELVNKLDDIVESLSKMV